MGFMVEGIPVGSSAPSPGSGEAYLEGSRVEFVYRGELKVGTVIAEGDRPRVVVDATLDEFTVPARLLRRSDVPVPRDPAHAMDDWGVRGYREHRSRSETSIAFTCAVTFRDRIVISASNDGMGGPNVHSTAPGVFSDMLDRFLMDAHRWLVDHGMPVGAICDAADTWLEWKANDAPFGVTATAMVADRLGKPYDRTDPEVCLQRR